MIDDEPVARHSLARRLAKLGYAVHEAPDGARGLQRMRDLRPDLVIVDWMMPEMDGPTLCEAVRVDPLLATSQIIMMTAHDQPDQIAEGLARGADDFLSKAASIQEIVARVRAALRTHALVRQLENTRDRLDRSRQELLAKQQILDEDLASSAQFVESLLPEQGSPAPGLRMAYRYLPSLALGGDLFGVSRWGTDRLGLYMLDASGHGVSAALRAAAMATFLHPEQVIRVVGSYDPAAIAAEANRRFPMTSEGHYFTLWIATLELKTWTLSWVSAGHPGAILCRPGHASIWLTQPAMPLGFMPDAAFAPGVCRVRPHDRIYMMSDGLYETMSGSGELWGRERLQHLLEQTAAAPLDMVIDRCLKESRAWQQAKHFDDDAALVGLERSEATDADSGSPQATFGMPRGERSS
ncbi:MAG TPA: SpoIIE family protein phosphatase [Nitrospira sp.]|nr:SpoIIE family protein phosphatase [Nitrospira sp.]